MYLEYAAGRKATAAAITTGQLRGVAATPMAVRAWRPMSSPNASTIRREAPLTTLVVRSKPGAASTKPSTRSQAATRSSEPMARLRLAMAARAASRAACAACSGVTSAPTGPKGPTMAPSGACGP
ncbi:MAG: hypothetical protein WDN08_08820 [Rhizomicrobium sp.]